MVWIEPQSGGCVLVPMPPVGAFFVFVFWAAVALDSRLGALSQGGRSGGKKRQIKYYCPQTEGLSVNTGEGRGHYEELNNLDFT